MWEGRRQRPASDARKRLCVQKTPVSWFSAFVYMQHAAFIYLARRAIVRLIRARTRHALSTSCAITCDHLFRAPRLGVSLNRFRLRRPPTFLPGPSIISKSSYPSPPSIPPGIIREDRTGFAWSRQEAPHTSLSRRRIRVDPCQFLPWRWDTWVCPLKTDDPT